MVHCVNLLILAFLLLLGRNQTSAIWHQSTGLPRSHHRALETATFTLLDLDQPRPIRGSNQQRIRAGDFPGPFRV